MTKWVGATLAVLAILAPAANAAPTVTMNGPHLTVTGDDSGETFQVERTATNVVVTGPPGMSDPDANQPQCNINGNGSVLTCSNAITLTATVDGGLGKDTLSVTTAGNAGEVVIKGGENDDTLIRNLDRRTSQMHGENGNDTLKTGPSGYLDRELDSGGEGNDRFEGSPGTDSLDAEPGADVYRLGEDPLADDSDSVHYSARTGDVTVTLDDTPGDGANGENDDVGSDVEFVAGGSGNDTLIAGLAAAQFAGHAGNDNLAGSAASDDLAGGGGSDVLSGGSGDDVLDDGDDTFVPANNPPTPGNDTLTGGPGDDTLTTGAGADDINGNEGFDRAFFGRFVGDAEASLGYVITLDNLANDGPRDVNEGDNVHSDVDYVSTLSGDDTITGSAGPDELHSGGGRDSVSGGAGADFLDLGQGDDSAQAVDRFTDRIICGAGSDSVTVDLPGGQPGREDSLRDCETVAGEPFPALPVIDSAAPLLTLGGPRTRKVKAFLKDGTLSLDVTCNEACSVEGEAYTDKARIAKVGRFGIGSGKLALGSGKRTLKVKLAKKYLSAYKKKLRKRSAIRKGVKIGVQVVVRDAAGHESLATRTFTVKG